MSRQKRHLTFMSITLTLALASMSYGRQAVGANESVADSHVDRYLSSHSSKSDPAPNPAARAETAVRGNAAVAPPSRSGGTEV
jgi:hypothetical protein